MISKVEQHHSDRWGKLGYERLDRIEKEYVGLYWLVGDVNNGGFDQYFFNSSGDLAKEALAALRRLDDHATTEILTAAMAAIPGGWIADREERQNRCEPEWEDDDSEFNQAMNDCDRRFYSLEHDHLQDFLKHLSEHYGIPLDEG